MRWLPLAARVFVLDAVVFGLVESLWVGPVAAVVGGVLFGLYMTAVLVGMAAYKLRGRPEVELTNRQRSSLVLPVAIADAHARATALLQAMPARITSGGDGARLEARTGVSWSSWGEIVSVQFVTADGATAVSVEARPRSRFALISDYRRTRGIVDHVAGGLAGPVNRVAGRALS